MQRKIVDWLLGYMIRVHI